MEDILKKNLSFIAMRNKPLCEKLLALNNLTKSFEITTNLAGQYNLLVNQKPVHSITDAIKESKELLNNIQGNENTSIHCLFGIGLGYHIDEYIQNAKGQIIVYEPDLETLYFVLSAVDFSDNFKSDRLSFVSDINEFEYVLNILYRYKTNVTLSFLDYYRLYHKQELEAFKNYLQRKVEITDHNYTFQVNNGYSFFKGTLSKLASKYKNPLLTDYKDIYKNKPALIVSAGPSLHKNIETIKKYKDNAIIFCVGTALRTLYNNGITPDFVNVIERNNTKVHYEVDNTKDFSLIVEPYTQAAYMDLDFKKILTTASLETDDARWFLEKAGKELVEFETKGTVAYHAIYSAYYFGCNPIILIGQDLAYTDGQCYSKGSNFDGIECVFDEDTQKYKVVFKDYQKFKESYCKSFKDFCSEERQEKFVNDRLEELNKNLYFVKGQDGNMLPTDSVYSLFIDYIEDFAKRHKAERRLINSSVGGALIQGFDIMPLEKVFESYAYSKLDKANIINTTIFKNNTDSNLLISNLKSDCELLKSLIPKFEKGLSLTTNLKKELNRAKIYTSQASVIANKLSHIYSEITNNFMLKHRIVKIIALKEYSEISYLTRLNHIINSYDDAKKYFEAYFDYFTNVYDKAKFVISSLQNTIRELEEINESCYTKS